MDEHIFLPATTIELIAELDADIPHHCILPGESLESAHRRAGARELIDALKARLEDDRDVASQSSTNG